MSILILGGRGMAGHIMYSYFKRNPKYTVYATSRLPKDGEMIHLDVTNLTKLEELIDKIKPDYIINCIGILNEDAENHPRKAFQINSLLPHQLAKLAERLGGKVIHISTDCVFSGSKGDYLETDTPDGTSVYAWSKQLGELKDDKHLTIRTSIIGPEQKESGIGLFQWFMKQQGQIKGFKQVLWNGVTTLELAKATEELMKQETSGLYHLCGPSKISKHDLLKLIQNVFNKRNVQILPDSKIILDRTIKNTRQDVSYQVPGYETMLIELKQWMNNRD